jgi:hypothetical protein
VEHGFEEPSRLNQTRIDLSGAIMSWMEWLGLGNGDSTDDPRLMQAIERAISLVEPRLKQAGGYPGRYRAVIGLALRYADQLAATIPGPVDLDREHYVRDPFVHALFASQDEIRRTLSLSLAMREYQQRPDAATDEIHALMGMRRNEKNCFGMEAEGEVVRREVAQHTVNFSDYTLSCIAADEAGTRALAAWSIFESLIVRIAGHVGNLREEKHDLEQRRDDLIARLRGTTGQRRATLEQELGTLLTELSEATQRLNLDRIPGIFEKLMHTPEALVRLEQRQFRLDGMGILRTQADTSASHLLAFTDLLGQDRRRWTVILVRCHHQELPPLAERLDDANRWLAI